MRAWEWSQIWCERNCSNDAGRQRHRPAFTATEQTRNSVRPEEEADQTTHCGCFYSFTHLYTYMHTHKYKPRACAGATAHFYFQNGSKQQSPSRVSFPFRSALHYSTATPSTSRLTKLNLNQIRNKSLIKTRAVCTPQLILSTPNQAARFLVFAL